MSAQALKTGTLRVFKKLPEHLNCVQEGTLEQIDALEKNKQQKKPQTKHYITQYSFMLRNTFKYCIKKKNLSILHSL